MNIKQAMHELSIIAERVYHQHTSEVMQKNRHFKMILNAMDDYAKAGSFSEVRIEVHFKPEIVPDFTKLVSQMDVLALTLSLEVTPRVHAVGLECHKETIEQIHTRTVRIGVIDDKGYFPVSFIEKKTERESSEHFRMQSLTGFADIIDRNAMTPVRSIWEFFIRGKKPE